MSNPYFDIEYTTAGGQGKSTLSSQFSETNTKQWKTGVASSSNFMTTSSPRPQPTSALLQQAKRASAMQALLSTE